MYQKKNTYRIPGNCKRLEFVVIVRSMIVERKRLEAFPISEIPSMQFFRSMGMMDHIHIGNIWMKIRNPCVIDRNLISYESYLRL